jgi:hypothetical protein
VQYLLKIPNKVFSIYYGSMSFIGIIIFIITYIPEFILIFGFNILCLYEVKYQGSKLNHRTHLLICSLLGMLFILSTVR